MVLKRKQISELKYIPSDEELQKSYLSLQKTFFPAVDKLWEEFCVLVKRGDIPVDSVENALQLFPDDVQAHYRDRLGL